MSINQESLNQKIINALIEGKASKVKSLVEVALQLGYTPKEIINNAMLLGMDSIGKKFKQNRLYIPDVMISARAMQAGLYVLDPVMKCSENILKPKIIIGTVAGDLHDIGKKLVILALQNAGMEVIDLGIDIPPDTFVNAVKEHKPDVLGMSALLTMTMPMLKETIDALDSNNLKKELKIIVGGSPVTYDYAINIGANGYANDAYETVDVIKNLT